MARTGTTATSRRPRSARAGAVVPDAPRARRPRPRGRAHEARRLPWVKIGLAVLAIALLAGGAVAVSRFLGPGGSTAAGPLAVLRTGDFHALAFSPDDPDTVLFGHHNGVMRSTDGGKTWSTLADRGGLDAMGMAVSRANPKQLFIAGHDVFQLSTDGGATWQPVQHNLPGTDVHGFAMSPDDPNRLYAFVNGSGTFASVDAGRTWRRLGETPPDVMGLAAAGGAPETVYAASMGSGIVRSTDGGAGWTPTGAGPRRALALAVDPSSRQTLYAGAEDGLYKTTDGGSSWARLPYPGRNAVAIAVSPARPTRVLAIHQDTQGRRGEVFRSDDGGQTWGG